jgi:hypothetical protein
LDRGTEDVKVVVDQPVLLKVLLAEETYQREISVHLWSRGNIDAECEHPRRTLVDFRYNLVEFRDVSRAELDACT